MFRLHAPCLLLLLGAGLNGVDLLAAADQPTIVVFLTDDQGQLDSQPYGAEVLRTPHMQQLADDGLTFTHAFVASPSCAPSRAALLTGLYPARNGAEPNHSKPRPELKKWPAFFQEVGYEVVAFGKVSHYKHTADYGFDYFSHDGFHDQQTIPDAVEYLKNRQGASDKPLCLMVGTNWPHVPWPESDLGYDPSQIPLPAKSLDTPETREFRTRYAAAVTKADSDLGAIRAAVHEYLDDEPLFLFTSDHGAQWPFGKWNCYDSGVRVPLVVAWPGVIAPGTRTDAMVSWIDLLPTLVEAAGGDAPEWIDGQSFLPVLKGEQTSHRQRIFTTHSGDGRWNIYPTRSVRTQNWKYIRNLHPEYAFTTHIDLANPRDGRTMFASWEQLAKADPQVAAIVKQYHDRPPEELYDLDADPFEEHNLAEDPVQVERLGRMRGEIDAWMAATGDQQQVFQEPRLLSDPGSYGPGAPPGNVKPAKKPDN
ncbi:MAG: sulfatase [Planctomycetaceae bacterium]|nr:sulfatase [Planctomycetaceae bacterium]